VQELQSIGFPNFQDTQKEDVQVVVPSKPKTKQPQKKVASKFFLMRVEEGEANGNENNKNNKIGRIGI